MISDVINDFSGGMVSKLSRDRIPINAASYLENFEYRDGYLRTRRGSRLEREALASNFYQGAIGYEAPFNSGGRETALIAQGGQIWFIQHMIDPYKFILPEAMDSDERVEFIQALKKVFIFRGDNNSVWEWDGVRTSDPSINAKMDGAHIALYAFNRIWTVRGLDELNVYDLLSENIDRANNVISITQGDGQKLVALSEFRKNTILAFKERSLAQLTGVNGTIVNASTDLTVEFIDSGIGCVAKKSIVTIGNDLWFLSNKGVMSVVENEEQKLQLIAVPISDGLQDIFDRINQAGIQHASAEYYDNYYILALPLDQYEYPNVLVIYDLKLRQWIGIHNFRDENGSLTDAQNNPVIEIMDLISMRFYTRDPVPFIVGREGEFLHILTSFQEKDFLGRGGYYISKQFNSEWTELSDIITETNLETQTSGIVEGRFRISDVFPGNNDGAIFSVDDSGVGPLDYLEFGYDSSGSVAAVPNKIYARCYVNNILQWQLELDETTNENEWHVFSLVQDGVEPYILFNTRRVPQTFTTSTDKTAWIADFNATANRVRLGRGVVSAICDISYISFQNYTGTPSNSGRASIVAHFPLNEGTGTTITASNDSSITGTLDPDEDWQVLFPESEIYSTLITRDFFNGTESSKIITNGELTFKHSNPKVSLTLLTPEKEEAQFTDRTYDETKFRIAGKTDYVNSNTNLDHNDDYRENYSPTSFPQAGLSMDATTGLVLNREVERTEQIFSGAVTNRIAAKVENKQGSIAIKSIALRANEKGFMKQRSLG